MSLNSSQDIIKFSIIIPVYNAEKYLERCLTSVLTQNIDDKEYEVIAINDGSQDHSEAILRSIGEKHRNLKWVSTLNRGVSLARNYGCEQARGKYLLFVDSDDCIQPNTLHQIYDILEKKSLDVLVMDYTYWDENNQIHLFSDAFRKTPLPRQVLPGKVFMTHCLPQVVWNSAYRTEFWRMHHLQFLPIRHEDEEILPKIFYFAERVLFKNINFYSYFRNPDSFMMNYDVKACINLVCAMNSVECFRKQFVKEIEINMFFKNLIASRLLSAVVLGVKGNLSHKDLMKVIYEMKESKLSPLPKGKQGIHKLLYEYLPSWFVTYYRLKKRNK